MTGHARDVSLPACLPACLSLEVELSKCVENSGGMKGGWDLETWGDGGGRPRQARCALGGKGFISFFVCRAVGGGKRLALL